MEKHRVSLLRQKNRWGLTALCIALCVLLSPALGMSIAMPQLVFLLPAVLLLMLAYVGPVSMTVCCGVLVVIGFLLFGAWGAVCVALFVVPVLAVSVLAVDQDRPFWPSALAGCVTAFISMCAVAGLLALLAGSDLVTAIGELTRQAFEASGTVGDSMLVMLAQLGAIGTPEGLTFLEESGRVALSEATRSEMLGELILALDGMLRLEIPMQMATGSVAAGLLGQTMLRRGLRRRGERVDCPPVRTWRIPKGWGRILGVTFAALLVMVWLVPAAASSTFYVFAGVLEQILALQGIATLCYVLHKNGKGRAMQALVFALGYFAVRPAACVLGVLDQAMDLSHRRRELEPQQENKDGGSGWMM
ncbi:MAG: DUF2232 domain-containing protein [Clostridia bacterium]|nr:DUF2232 domain-containing protein [Clostridia bacterium]